MRVPDEWPSRRGNSPNRTRLTGRLVDKGRSFGNEAPALIRFGGVGRLRAVPVWMQSERIALGRPNFARNWPKQVRRKCALAAACPANPQPMGI